MTLTDDLTSLTVGAQTILHCAICGSAWVHLAGIRTLATGDDYQAEFCRGDAVRLHLFCEDGHHFDIDLGQHKGNERLRVSGNAAAISDVDCAECRQVSFPEQR